MCFQPPPHPINIKTVNIIYYTTILLPLIKMFSIVKRAALMVAGAIAATTKMENRQVHGFDLYKDDATDKYFY